MNVIVTCGPSIEPIDQVRRLTNFATGELGVLLCNRLRKAGYTPICLKGTSATTLEPLSEVEMVPFTTNEDLQAVLAEIASSRTVAALFHTAALCDFRVQKALSATGVSLTDAKIPTSHGAITLTLEPATKIIGTLRGHFPNALIVGWKYELSGTAELALERAHAQISRNRTDACVLNGTAYGMGFGFVESARQEPLHLKDKKALCEFLCHWLEKRTQAG